MTLAFKAEMDNTRVRATLDTNLGGLKTFLNNIDTSNYCYIVYTVQAEIDSKNSLYNFIECQNVYYGLMPVGFNSVVVNSINYVKKMIGEYMELPVSKRTNFANITKRDYSFVKMSKIKPCYLIDDIRAYYGDYTFDLIFDTFMQLHENWLTNNMLILNVKFSIYIIFLVIIFILLWQKMVSNMQMDIIKALGILNILPTSHLAQHPEFLVDMNKSSLIN